MADSQAISLPLFRFSQSQTILLAKEFAENQELSKHRAVAACNLGVKGKQVKRWFKKARERPPHTMPSMQWASEHQKEALSKEVENRGFLEKFASVRATELSEEMGLSVSQILKWTRKWRCSMDQDVTHKESADLQGPKKKTSEKKDKPLDPIPEETKNPKRKAKEQVEFLKKALAENSCLPRSRAKALGEKCGLSYTQVETFFLKNRARKRAPVVKLTEQQLAILTEEFAKSARMPACRRKALADMVNLSENKIRSWFCSRRIPTRSNRSRPIKLTESQLTALNNEFTVNGNVSFDRKRELAVQLGLSVKCVVHWFYKMRISKGMYIRRAPKHFLSPEQERLLQNEFDKSSYLPAGQAQAISEGIGVTPACVTFWFTTKRQPSEKRPPPIKYTKTQLKVMITEFEKCPKPSPSRIEDLAREIGVTAKRVSQWFEARPRKVGLRWPTKDYVRQAANENEIRLNWQEVMFLQNEFKKGKYLSPNRAERLTSVMCLPEAKILQWFGTKRWRERKTLNATSKK